MRSGRSSLGFRGSSSSRGSSFSLGLFLGRFFLSRSRGGTTSNIGNSEVFESGNIRFIFNKDSNGLYMI